MTAFFIFIKENFSFFIIFLYIWHSKFGKKEEIMARKCQVTDVGPVSGHSISHAHNKSKRRFLPNLQKKRIWVKELNKFVTVRVSASALRTIAKNGTSQIAKLVKEKKIKAR